MKRLKSIHERALCWLLACTACHDITAVVGRLHPDRDAAAAAASDAGRPVDKPGTLADSGAIAQGDAAAPPPRTRTPALAPPARQKVWDIEPGSRNDFCAGRGSALRSASDCVPIERQLFSYALCACREVRLTGDSFNVDAFDSSRAAYAPGQGGAAVGVEGAFSPAAADIQIGGNLIVTDENPLSITGEHFVVHGDLASNAALAVSSHGVRIARDAWLAGEVRGPAPGSIAVGRDAYLRPGVMGGDALRGRVLMSDFALSPPCACEPSAPLDVPGIVAMAHGFADNDAAGFAKDSLRGLIDTTNLELPCGRFVLSELSSPIGTIAFMVSGRTALFIEGNVDLTGTFVFWSLSETAELDLFVAGDLKLQGTVSFGAPAKPSAMRIYVGGQISVTPALILSGGLYAPHASLSNLAADTYGSLFVGSLETSGATRLHYDRAFLDAPPQCPSAARSCASCDECGEGLACVAGSCAACTQDSDCCAPLACVAGRCSPLIVPLP